LLCRHRRSSIMDKILCCTLLLATAYQVCSQNLLGLKTFHSGFCVPETRNLSVPATVGEGSCIQLVDQRQISMQITCTSKTTHTSKLYTNSNCTGVASVEITNGLSEDCFWSSDTFSFQVDCAGKPGFQIIRRIAFPPRSIWFDDSCGVFLVKQHLQGQFPLPLIPSSSPCSTATVASSAAECLSSLSPKILVLRFRTRTLRPNRLAVLSDARPRLRSRWLEAAAN